MIFQPVEKTAVTPGGAYSPRRYRFSLVTAVATFILIIAGGLVTSQQAGDSVPDWPLNFGRIVPWEQLVGNVRFEYGHRVIAATVGLLTILLNIVLWRDEPRRWVRQLGLLALIAVVLQGLLGGVRVLLLEYRVPVAIIHACLAQTFFSLIVGLTVFTSRAWFEMANALFEGNPKPMRGNPKHEIRNSKRFGFRDSDFGFSPAGVSQVISSASHKRIEPSAWTGRWNRADQATSWSNCFDRNVARGRAG
ncbi:MAG: COX15/CtaA family protein, partial [Blastocatellia bacterium]|nr:COX15/CtaA family protein [Blastocatellia bacterium]